MTDQTPDERRAKRAVGDTEDVSDEIVEDFEERQRLAEGGRPVLKRLLRDTTMQSPELSAGDVDASWQTDINDGSESFTGHMPTPDQDVVDELGAAAGLTYRDHEPLNYAKISERDEHRWELDPASADETLSAGHKLDEDDQYDLGLDDETEDELFSDDDDEDAEDDLEVEAALEEDDDELLEAALEEGDDEAPGEDEDAGEDDEVDADEDDEADADDDEDEDEVSL